MKLKYDFTVMEMGKEVVAVPVGKDADAFHGMIRMNKSGAEILELLREETTLKDVCAQIAKRYSDSSESEIAQEVEKFVNILLQQGVLLD